MSHRVTFSPSPPRSIPLHASSSSRSSQSLGSTSTSNHPFYSPHTSARQRDTFTPSAPYRDDSHLLHGEEQEEKRGGRRGWGSFARRRTRWLILGLGFSLVVLVGWKVIGQDSSDGEKVFEEGARLVEETGRRVASPPPPILPLPPPKAYTPRPPGPIDMNVHPSPIPRPPFDPTERYLAYSPHSGYHNQRIALENALTLSFILNRTLLLPPVWLGHAIPYIAYDKLQRRLEIANKDGLDRCKDVGEGQGLLMRECEGWFDWTRVGWSFMVDLGAVGRVVRMRDRWNMSREWIDDELGLEQEDRYEVKDDRLYQYRYYDDEDDEESLAKFEHRLVVEDLRIASRDYKLLHLGSLFGTSRIRTTKELNFDARSLFRESMVFKNELLDDITTTIRDRLGGSGNYYGLHLRVGDGVFQKGAKGNMEAVWKELCEGNMKVATDVCAAVISLDEAPRLSNRLGRRSAATKQSNSRPQRPGAHHHPPLPSPILVRSRSDSLLHSSLTCRRPLHTNPSLLPFNTPLFIATDSKLPESDPHLSLFLTAFPCTFFLGDFSSISPLNTLVVSQLDELRSWRGSEDKVPLAQFFYPQLDAGVAAWGRALIGTPASTYSSFAVDVLHQVNHGWDIIQRG